MRQKLTKQDLNAHVKNVEDLVENYVPGEHTLTNNEDCRLAKTLCGIKYNNYEQVAQARADDITQAKSTAAPTALFASLTAAEIALLVIAVNADPGLIQSLPNAAQIMSALLVAATTIGTAIFGGMTIKNLVEAAKKNSVLKKITEKAGKLLEKVTGDKNFNGNMHDTNKLLFFDLKAKNELPGMRYNPFNNKRPDDNEI